MHIPGSTDNIRLSGNCTPSQVANQDLASHVLLFYNQSDKTPDSELCASDSSNKCIRRPFFSPTFFLLQNCAWEKKGCLIECYLTDKQTHLFICTKRTFKFCASFNVSWHQCNMLFFCCLISPRNTKCDWKFLHLFNVRKTQPKEERYAILCSAV